MTEPDRPKSSWAAIAIAEILFIAVLSSWFSLIINAHPSPVVHELDGHTYHCVEERNLWSVAVWCTEVSEP